MDVWRSFMAAAVTGEIYNIWSPDFIGIGVGVGAAGRVKAELFCLGSFHSHCWWWRRRRRRERRRRRRRRRMEEGVTAAAEYVPPRCRWIVLSEPMWRKWEILLWRSTVILRSVRSSAWWETCCLAQCEGRDAEESCQWWREDEMNVEGNWGMGCWRCYTRLLRSHPHADVLEAAMLPLHHAFSLTFPHLKIIIIIIHQLKCKILSLFK